MAMHATQTRLGGWLDILAMYLVAAFMAAYAIWRFLRVRWVWFALLFLTVVGICCVAQQLQFSRPSLRNLGDLVFGLFVAVAALFEALNAFARHVQNDLRWCGLSLGLLLVAFGIWNLSLHHAPSRSLIQGHALWHLLCAAAAYCQFRYYLSGERRSVGDSGPTNPSRISAALLRRSTASPDDFGQHVRASGVVAPLRGGPSQDK